MRIALLHTGEVHVATFNQIFAELACDVELVHRVEEELLDRARRDGIDAIRDDVAAILNTLSGADAVLCTCSTLGPLVDEAAENSRKIVRIDRPLMEQACEDGEKILVALCLESTRDATLDLLEDCAKRAGKGVTPIVVFCKDAWALFEAGDMEGYATSIADAVKAKLIEESGVQSIVLAQASMRAAQAKLTETGLPVRSSPVISVKRSLKVAGANS